MKQLIKPKFYANIDRSHCVQACLKSLFSITNPELKPSWDYLEKLTEYIPEHGAWVYPELLALNRYGLEAQLVTGFDIDRFIKEGFDYIEDAFGKDVADYERKHPHDYERIKRQMQEAVGKDLIVSRHGRIEDVRSYIENGWYVMALVNSKALNGKEGYTGHRVLIYGFDEAGVIMNDPGPNDDNDTDGRKVSWELFDRAWQNGKDLIAVRKNN